MYIREIRINGKDHMIRSKHSEANAWVVLWKGEFYSWTSDPEKYQKNLTRMGFTKEEIRTEFDYKPARLIRCAKPITSATMAQLNMASTISLIHAKAK